MRISDSMIAATIAARMRRAGERLFRLQAQVASGRAFTAPSEDPPGATRAAALRSSLAEMRRYQENCTYAETRLRLTEVSLGTLFGALREVRVAALSMTPTEPAGNQALADQVQAAAETITAELNTVSQGRYLFAGYEVLTKPVVENPAGPPPYVYQGDRGDAVVQLGRGVSTVANLDAAEVLNLDGAVDPARGDALETLRKIEEALRSEDHEAMAEGLEDLQWDMDRVVSLRAEVGTRVQAVEVGQRRLGETLLTLEGLLSETEDVDITEVIIELRAQEVTYQAAAAAAAALHRASLLEYL